MTATRHLIGLLLGTEEDWPRAFEEILHRLGPVKGPRRHPPRIRLRADQYRAVQPA